MPVVGCDIGGTAIKIVGLRRGRISWREEIPSRPQASATEFVARLCDAVHRRLSAGDDLGALGMALPGFLDEARRKIVRLSNLPALDGHALAKHVEGRLGAPVILDTDTNAGAVGEARRGAGRGHERLLYVTLGTGLGAALAIRGRPARVSYHSVGQVAHIPLSSEGPRCRCGQRGCAEALLCARGIARRAGLRPHRDAPRALWAAAEAGDASAQAAWHQTGELLAVLLRILVPLFRPEIVVVGGGVATASRHFLPAATASLARRLPREFHGRVEIKASSLERYAGAVGAALLARDAVT